MTQVISQRETLPCAMVSTKYKKKNGKFRIQKVGIQNSETGIQNSGNFRIQNRETGFQNRETGILKIGNWTGKLQNSEFRKLDWETSGFRNFRIQNSGNWISEFRIGKLDFRIGKL